MAHLDIAHYFGRKLPERRRGGLILVGAMGAENGVPCIANDGASKAYVHSLGEALHYEFKPLGVYVTLLATGFANTAVLEKLGFDPKTMPMKPMSVEQCVSEGLSGLLKNRSRIVPGRLNRIMNALVPASLARKMEADMLGKGLASKSAVASARGEAQRDCCRLTSNPEVIARLALLGVTSVHPVVRSQSMASANRASTEQQHATATLRTPPSLFSRWESRNRRPSKR
jgi:hypothetical protein